MLIDIDPQCSINFDFGKDWNYSHRKTIMNVATNEIKLSDAIISANENLDLDLLLSDINLNNYD
ncbi:MAG: AAA family ATPase [Ureaplasma sp.]|nr:AAA family ATPase [Ureaplasma sp.]